MINLHPWQIRQASDHAYAKVRADFAAQRTASRARHALRAGATTRPQRRAQAIERLSRGRLSAPASGATR